MGTYLYKVTSATAPDNTGRKCNLLKLCFKISFWADNDSAKAFNAGLHTAERFVEKSPNYTGRCVMEPGGPSLAVATGTVTDDSFYSRLELISRANEIDTKNWLAANPEIGTLTRDGKTIYYVYPAGGTYRELLNLEAI